MPTVTAIKSCATTACAFNNGGCTAFAITVGGDAATPARGGGPRRRLPASGVRPQHRPHVHGRGRLLQRRQRQLPVLRGPLSAGTAKPVPPARARHG